MMPPKKRPLIYPRRLKRGDHIRVIAPSRSGSILSSSIIASAKKRLTDEGFVVSFGKYWQDSDSITLAASVDARIIDLHEAFADPSVDCILTAIGGNQAIQLLQDIDYGLIRDNPKVFCGFSDATTLLNAVTSVSGLVTYLGPHFSTWAMQEGFEYSAKAFLQSVTSNEPYNILPSKRWSDDAWYLDQNNRHFFSNNDYGFVIQPGKARGNLVGGNVKCVSDLMDTKYAPDIDGSILLLEQSEINNDLDIFQGLLKSIVNHSNFSGVKGVLIGRFPRNNFISNEELRKIILAEPKLKNIPIAANINFGHTSPIATFAIGGICDINIDKFTIIIHCKH